MTKEQRKELNKKVWTGPIENKELATYIVKETTKGFYVIAGLQIVGGIILGLIAGAEALIATIIGAVIGAAIIAGLAYWLQAKNSKIAAIILVILGVLSVIGSLGSIASGAAGVGSIAISVLTLWFAARAFQATSFLSKNAAKHTQAE